MKKFKLSGHTALRSIQAGKVKVDGEVVTVGGAFVSENQRIEFQKPPLVVYALNKPVGVLSKPEANDNPTVLEFLPPGDLSVSGRLDKDSSGLIVASNDGSLVFDLINPDHDVEKEYFVTVTGNMTDSVLNELRAGVKVLGEETKPTKVRKVSENSFYITLTEGKNRQIRRMCRSVGLNVVKLHRVRIGHFTLPKDIPEGFFKELSKEEISELTAQIPNRPYLDE